LDWLADPPERLQTTVDILQPVGELLIRSDGCGTLNINCRRNLLATDAAGVIALIYEAFPELGAIAAGLCIKTSNSLILKVLKPAIPTL